MRDDNLLADLHNTPCPEQIVASLQAHTISTYSQLFAVLRDVNANDELRADACFAVMYLRDTIDSRRAVPPLLVALQSNAVKVREVAVRALGALEAKRAVDVLIQRVVDDTEDMLVRFNAIQALSHIAGERVIVLFKQWIHDPALDIRIRATTLEWIPEYDGFLDDCIRFLSDESADMRFWAAFRIPQPGSSDISKARAALDHVAAFDHSLPVVWGWHVDREALRGLEHIDYAAIVGTDEISETWLISSASEFATYMNDFRQWRDDWLYDTLPAPLVNLHIDDAWLRASITDKWPQTQFNVRPAGQQTYLLDWHIVIDNQHLIGGLHRDAYAVVLTGEGEVVFQFASWFRSQISADVTLYLYEWAGTAIEIPLDNTADEVAGR